ncbi:arginine--tRNA ligase [Mycoplasma marinum]|uniref:Arginine--tRNA ligase n=1 Tax=Mycoplasma marinum TaxID=1937190 RepID=A0A4R0XVH2_9MOLU|nr:arginine--tRNA ligase [Mycoplasma marinum]TCG10921.1 arginine--tRNA ligase [Mycoplasma marinum]
MKNKIIKALQDSLKLLGTDAKIQLTPSKDHGDFSTNVAMKLAKELKDSPINIAKKIIEGINKEENLIDKVEIAGPGFINFFMKQDALNTIITDILTAKDNYGMGTENEYVNVEYVSANPTGYLHLGHARGAVVGSILVNVLRFAGNKVDAEYYVNDAGAQIDILGEAAWTRYQQEYNIDVQMPENTYRGQDVVWVAQELKEIFGDKYVNVAYEECKDIFKQESKKLLLEQIEIDLNKLGVNMDFYSSEQKMYDEGRIIKALDKLEDKFEEDGATWLRTTKYGDDKDRVLIKSDGSYTYLSPDIAYHDVKLSRGYDYIINIFGADHIGYIKRMEVALLQLGYPDGILKDTLIIQLVRLIQDGKELKMSKRMGTSFTIRELIDLAGKDATRFFMANRSCDSKFDFNVNLAKQKTSENPVFYIQYAHARANQILDKTNFNIDTSKLYTIGAEKLMSELKKFPELVSTISRTRKIHLLPQYLIDLAKAFHSYYNSNKIVGSENEQAMLPVVVAAKQVLKNGLTLLGISAPNQM